ncbi:PREDICTED: GRAM domain-containing protein 4-like isoform X2 [Amphimedon queenslandica]|uniref:GRAM domain-containing protein n=2 Tax=Amphimedon queenslandica TaxID=400682 RepID=A0AAN0JF58_AMPQE|nr:PREDICTED: GRAM domain-containing protein 4-like isoform X2 [Amphimedon queenslandica]|eukprot:XP_019855670.1 PREDICTED: GRAM domain-containing protein 4-like isoform X2 [Amphimedon queenslandica]
MIRRALIARRKEKERDSLRYTREGGDEDELVDVEDKYEAIGIEEAEKLSACDEKTEDTLSTLEKVWDEADKVVYEQQMEHLHNQLEAALIDNQELKMKLKSIESREAKSQEAKTKKYGSYRGRDLSTSTTRESFESVSSQPTTPPDITSSRPSRYVRWWDRIKDNLFEILYDFTDDSQTEEEEAKEAPLQYKLLRENLQRLRVSSKPYLDLLDTLIAIKNWKNPLLTLVIFLLYMYCVWNGWLIQCLLLLAIIYLSLNYLRTTGLTGQFGFGSHPARGSEDDSHHGTSETLRDKFQLMKHIGQRIQNTSETVSDNLEKGQNLLEWYQPQSTRKVYTMLCGAFIATLFIPNDYSMTIAGLGIGFNLFIRDNIYRKYPNVKNKYDGFARMWRSLPTHKDIITLQSMTEDEIREHCESGSELSSLTSSSSTISIRDTSFCERFQLSFEETPLESWRSGKRCTLLEKDRPLTGSKQGRIFLTHSFLCFERSPRPNDSADRFTISLGDISKICKAKPFAVLPGSGMSIEVTVKGREKPYLFGAILHHDQAYLSICDQAMIIGLPWGSDLDSSERQTFSTLSARDPSPSWERSGGNTSLEECWR